MRELGYIDTDNIIENNQDGHGTATAGAATRKNEAELLAEAVQGMGGRLPGRNER